MQDQTRRFIPLSENAIAWLKLMNTPSPSSKVVRWSVCCRADLLPSLSLGFSFSAFASKTLAQGRLDAILVVVATFVYAGIMPERTTEQKFWDAYSEYKKAKDKGDATVSALLCIDRLNELLGPDKFKDKNECAKVFVLPPKKRTRKFG